MRKVLSITILFIILLNLSVQGSDREKAPENGVFFEGMVMEDISQEPIAGAKIEIKDSQTVVYSDFDGKFKLDNIRPGTYTLTVSFSSFEDLTIENVSVSEEHKCIFIKLH